ncbi:MAG TPA: Gfo/Idh/MocA family oxidoreductase [Cytophagaceae bacterium]|jgi:predicted dehydrogenase|nr:Gfo/Idh/MocA family oxidoreductase [Cytophagaceae bacterium]
MNSTLKWGIIGPGKIAQKFAEALNNVEDAALYAVASRSIDSAIAFAGKYNAVRAYGTYEELVLDPEVDLVYVATPHVFHKEHTLLCLNHKKPVLCEKPLAHCLHDVQAMVTASKTNQTFLMEAMWTRFLPPTNKALELIRSGAIGMVTNVKADFGFFSHFDEKSRLYDLALGGGSLLDIGVYPLFLVLTVLGEPSGYEVEAKLAATGADEDFKATLYYPQAEAQIHSSMIADTAKTAEIRGTEGTIYFVSPWYRETSLVLKKKDGSSETFTFPATGNGFEPEIKEAMNCVRNGKIESDIMSHEFSLLQSKILDLLCKEAGVIYR